jgi:hypothetical protein
MMLGYNFSDAAADGDVSCTPEAAGGAEFFAAGEEGAAAGAEAEPPVPAQAVRIIANAHARQSIDCVRLEFIAFPPFRLTVVSYIVKAKRKCSALSASGEHTSIFSFPLAIGTFQARAGKAAYVLAFP